MQIILKIEARSEALKVKSPRIPEMLSQFAMKQKLFKNKL